MKNVTLILIIGLLVLSCSKNNKEFEGELYFKLIDIGNFYGADEKTIENLETSFDSIRRSKTAGKNELEFIRIIDKLKANNLLKSPWINLKTETEFIKIFLTESEYEKLKPFDRNTLITDHKKVRLKIEVIELDSGIYFSDRISEIKIVQGETYWRK